MKKVACLTSLVIMTILGYAQVDSVYFNEWGSLTTKDSANYFTIWSELDSGNIRTAYFLPNNKVKFVEIYQDGVKTGKCSYYHKNGNLHYEAAFHNNQPTGIVLFYYPNGALESERVYEKAQEPYLLIESKLNYGIINYYDSTGKWLTKNGFGVAYEYEIGKESTSKAQGKIVDGLKDSIWISHYQDGNLYYTELWDKGTLINGKSIWFDGKEYSYQVIEKMAEPTDGMRAFYQYVGQTMRYPRDAIRSDIQGKVFVEFVVHGDGSISRVKVLRGIGGGCDEEAVRVVSSARKWKPGLQRGRPVRTKFSLPVSFKISE